MKNIFNNIWGFLVSMGEARYAAYLASQGRIKEAQDLYRN
jgi:hypothetical protein